MKKFVGIVALIALLATLLLPAAAMAEGDWENILFLGCDSRTENGFERSDSMIIVSINRETNQVKLTSIMRDTWVNFPGRSNPNKINAATVFGGPELAMATVNANFGTDIEKYVQINMRHMAQVIDLFGGVDVDVTDGERNLVNAYAPGLAALIDGYPAFDPLTGTGLVHLNGAQAVSYSRIRKIDSDYNRVMRQQEVLLSLAYNAQEMEVDELMERADEVLEYIETNLTDDELKELANAALVVEIEDVEQNRIPVDGTFKDGMFGKVWCIKPDFQKNAKLLHEFIYGE